MNYIIHTPRGARVKKEIVDNNNHTAVKQEAYKIVMNGAEHPLVSHKTKGSWTSQATGRLQ